jgi:DnaJ-domain-containing protein 1
MSWLTQPAPPRNSVREERIRLATQLLASLTPRQRQVSGGFVGEYLKGEIPTIERLRGLIVLAEESLPRNVRIATEPPPDSKREAALRVLGLEPGANHDEIQASYWRLARIYHPDKPGGDVERMKELNNAFRVLVPKG